MLAELLPAEIFGVFMVFVRIGAALMVMPGFGEIYIATNIRLAIAIFLTLAMAPAVVSFIPAMPATPLELLLLISGELLVGLLIGLVGRLSITALHVAGTVIAFQSSLAFALMMDPAQGIQGALIASFFSLLGLVLIFAADLHLVMIRGIHDSYQIFPPGDVPLTGDMAEMVLDLIASSFKVGVQMAAPFIVYGVVLYTGIGLLARLMPQLPFFFVIMPLQLYAAFSVLALTISGAMLWFLTHYEQNITDFMIAK
jgi:flagellar biosynthetic protein FliR